MKISRLKLSALLLTTTAVLWSCSDLSPISAPPPPPPAATVSPDLLGGLIGTVTTTLNSTVNTLLPCSPLQAATTTQTIGWAGGTIKVGPHKFVIPAGALSSPVTITASIKSEKVNRIHFSPDGLQFAQPATLTMSYANCSIVSALLPTHQIVYVTPNLKILENLLSLDNLLSRSVSAKVSHFSDYAVDDTSFSDHASWW
jgi:hypothetical protein